MWRSIFAKRGDWDSKSVWLQVRPSIGSAVTCRYHGLLESFDTIKCADDVTHAKPAPDVYLAALQALEVEAEAAVAFEDSPNGLLAAKCAGIFCVAVPNAITRQLVFEGADLVLSSLAEMALGELLRLKEKVLSAIARSSSSSARHVM